MADGYSDGTGASAALIGGHFSIDLTRPLPDAGGGLPAFAAQDRRGERQSLMAVSVAAHAPARADVIAALSGNPPGGVLAPLAHGAGPALGGGTACYVVGHAPPGPALMSADGRLSGGPWTESELLTCLLRPAAIALETLRTRGITHRAIRPCNLFRVGSGEAVVLGSAWSGPAGGRAAALYEPPYVAMCVAGGAGDGTIADDMYALGVTLLVLAVGREPLDGLDEGAIIRRKLEHGSYGALVGDARLPQVVADLVRGLLAEDPDHRPPPALLADPIAARARRVAARPRRRAQRALQVGSVAAWDTRMLAFALTCEPEQSVRMLRAGEVDQWLRRSLGESSLAARLDEYVRLHVADSPGDQRGEAMLLMRLVAQLDPLAPLCWRGMALWPDSLGRAIAAAGAGGPGSADVLGRLTEVVLAEAAVDWSSLRTGRKDPARARQQARQESAMLRQRGWSGGIARLCYALNPLLPCRSPLVAARAITRAADLLMALEDVAASVERRVGLPIDREAAAFLLARDEKRLETYVAALGDTADPEAAALPALRLFAQLQSRLGVGPLPSLAAWLAERASLAQARGLKQRRRRADAAEATGRLVAAGDLVALLALADDLEGRSADTREAQAAIAMVQQIDDELARLAVSGPARAEIARRLGGEVAASLGLAVLAVTGIVAAVAP